MTKFAWAWVWLGFLVVLDILIPWFALTNLEKIGSSFLFWTIWAAVAIVSAYFIFLRWKEINL